MGKRSHTGKFHKHLIHCSIPRLCWSYITLSEQLLERNKETTYFPSFYKFSNFFIALLLRITFIYRSIYENYWIRYTKLLIEENIIYIQIIYLCLPNQVVYLICYDKLIEGKILVPGNPSILVIYISKIDYNIHILGTPWIERRMIGRKPRRSKKKRQGACALSTLILRNKYEH